MPNMAFDVFIVVLAVAIFAGTGLMGWIYIERTSCDPGYVWVDDPAKGCVPYEAVFNVH